MNGVFLQRLTGLFLLQYRQAICRFTHFIPGRNRVQRVFFLFFGEEVQCGLFAAGGYPRSFPGKMQVTPFELVNVNAVFSTFLRSKVVY